MAVIRILHADLSDIGGAELLLADQARWLIGRGHDVEVLALRATRERWRDPLRGVPTRILAAPPKIERLRTPASMAPLVAAARDALIGADVVVAHNFPAAPIAAHAAPAGARRVWYAHEPYRALHPEATHPAAAARAAAGHYDDAPTRQFARRARRRRFAQWLAPWKHAARVALAEWDAEGVARLDAVVANSGYTAQMVATALGRRVDAVVPPAIAFGGPRPPRTGLARTAPAVLTQTRLGVPKHVDLLIRAIAVARASQPTLAALQLHVAGDGPQREALERLARAVAPAAVTFHGYIARDAVAALSAQCDVFALVPVDEPFGMVFPEAIARGQLVVGPDHGGPSEILEGIAERCSAFDAEAVAAAIGRCFALDDAAAEARRAAADASVRARYAPDVVLPALERALLG